MMITKPESATNLVEVIRYWVSQHPDDEMFRFYPKGEGEFTQQLRDPLSDEALLQKIMATKKTRHDQWQVQSMLQIAQEATLHLHSALSDQDQAITRCTRCDDIAATIKQLAGEKALDIAVLPRGPLTIPTFKSL